MHHIMSSLIDIVFCEINVNKDTKQWAPINYNGKSGIYYKSPDGYDYIYIPGDNKPQISTDFPKCNGGKFYPIINMNDVICGEDV